MWQVFVEQMAPVVANIVGAALSVAMLAATTLILRRLGLEKVAHHHRTHELVLTWVEEGVALAEHRGLVWARDRGELPEGAQKLEWALQHVVREMKEAGIPELARDRLVHLVEAVLGTPSAPGHEDRAEAVAMRLKGADLEVTGDLSGVLDR